MAREETLQLLESLYARRHEAMLLHGTWAQSLKSNSCRRTVRAVGLIHGVRTVELMRSARLMGGTLTPPSSPRVGLRLHTTLTAVRGDRAIMRHLLALQSELVKAYVEASAHPSSKPVRRVLERHLVEEQRHLAWLGHRSDELGRTRRRHAVA